MMPKTTLIITTYNWPEALNLVLKSLLNQSKAPNEVIIADDGSLDNTKSLIASLKNKFEIPLIHIWQEDTGFRRSAILNKAITKATGDYIIQVDGDVILHRHFIKDHLKNVKDNMFLFGNRVTIKEQESKRILKKQAYSFNYFSKGIKKRNRLVRLSFFRYFSKPKNQNSSKLRGCNLSYWKKDALAINGYNEDLHGWGYEDYEFTQRLINKGVLGKRIKHSAIQYHLFHQEAPKGSTIIGDKVLNNAVHNKVFFIKNGIVKNNNT